ncbi:E3 ubiquitin-protein ligase MIB2 [Episyrphus balteatus]|uniref:E3 ubiquitin-protein ligase MIB2 n=1 Tax=Episyrphus balteatus TaxID=286459 RepID=UPI002485049D|nr:E3 ubiquitin-protein ligase MIB2 [Episyrphus balteatus]
MSHSIAMANEQLLQHLINNIDDIFGQAENYTQNAIFKTEQGKYLASSLGDPLIKGLTEIAEKRPTDPVAYLAGFLQNFIKSRNNINNNNNDNDNNNNRDNDTGDTNSTALANSDAEIITTPNHVNGVDSPDQQGEERFSTPESTPKKEDRDEHGQSMLHFACARSHRRNGLLNLIEESQIDVTYRDELYRTARDVSLQANQPGNAKEIDRFVLSLAVVGDTKPFEHMAVAGYDHILDVIDDEGTSISDVAESRGHDKLVEFLTELRDLEGSREELHQATRNGDFERIKEITSTRKGKWLIKAKNYYGRNAMHIAVLKEQEEIVEYYVNTCSDALKIGDNLERTPLHYAMGTNSVESISRVLIRKGAKRTTKDLKGRQPSYYFINKADILRLQEEEDEHR